MTEIRRAYCSWCFHSVSHERVRRSRVGRDEYRCGRCHGRTYKCRWCENMARGRPDPAGEALVDRIKTGWNRELCAEHAGEIASFETVRTRVKDLADYRVILDRHRRDLRKLGKQAMFAAGSIALFAPIAMQSAAAVATSMGARGLLGRAITGTAIKSLSGSALRNASLAAIGRRFGVKGGVTLLTTAGAALGAIEGVATANAYFGEIDGFTIRKLRQGSGAAILFIDGFLTQQEDQSAPWQRGTAIAYSENPLYSVTWESKRLADLGYLVGSSGSRSAIGFFVRRHATKGIADFSSPIPWATFASRLTRNPWHTAMSKAQTTGYLLAELIARTENPEGFTLMGHSLGARVVYYALEALSGTGREVVCDAYLLGAAVGAGSPDSWRKASSCVRGTIYNCHSERDAVLRHLYRGANAFLSQPAGLGPIDASESSIRNVDVTDLVAKHTEYKAQLAPILDRAHQI